MKTEDLIESLSAEAGPVRRLAPPSRRAGLWLLLCLALFVLAVLATDAWAAMQSRLTNPRFALEMSATLLTGLTAIIAAFNISLPDRTRAWALLPLPFVFAWIGSSGYQCYRNWFTLGPDQSLAMGESFFCFGFMVSLSVPLSLALYMAVARTRTLYPVQVMALGGLGVAGLAALLLQFFHPFDVTAMDLIFHALAAALIVAVLSLFGRTGMRFRVNEHAA